MRPLLSFRVWTLALSVLLLAQSSSAAPGVVHLKDGRSLMVEILEIQEGSYLLIRDSNGNDFTIEWQRIERFETGTPAAPPEAGTVAPGAASTAQPAAPAATSGRPGATPVPGYGVPPLMAPTARMQLQTRIGILDRKIERLDDDMPSIGGPIVMTSVGFAAGGFFLFAGIAGMSDCGASSLCNRKPYTIMSVLGGVGIATGIGGVVLLIRAIEKRKPFKEEMRELETERDALESELDAAFVPGGAVGTWSLVF